MKRIIAYFPINNNLTIFIMIGEGFTWNDNKLEMKPCMSHRSFLILRMKYINFFERKVGFKEKWNRFCGIQSDFFEGKSKF